MIGIFLIIFATMFEEVSTSSAKESITRHVESVSSRAFLVGMWSILFLSMTLIGGVSWKFSLASLPFFCLRIFIEIFQTHITIKAIALADRSTFGFVRTLTIPLILCIDVLLGTQLLMSQVAGIIILVAALLILSLRHSLSWKGVGFAIMSAIGSSITLSLYKYDITHFNSVAAEQIIATAIILPYFLWHAIVRLKENPFHLLRSPRILRESAMSGIGGIIGSFAYAFAPASVIVAAQRSSSVIWSVIAGALHFHERHVFEKFSILGLAVIGVVLLVH